MFAGATNQRQTSSCPGTITYGSKLGSAANTSSSATQIRIRPKVAYGRVSGAMPAISSARSRGSFARPLRLG